MTLGFAYRMWVARFGQRGLRYRMGAVVLALLVAAGGAYGYEKDTTASGSGLTYDNQREVAVPSSALIRIGRFYSSIAFLSSASYRYTSSSGEGTDYLDDGDRGKTLKDGSDFPIVTALDFRNYMLLGRHADLDISFTVAYRYFPMGTEEDQLDISVPDERIGGTVSSGFQLTRNVKGRVYDNAEYITQYLDDRGYDDNQSGNRNEEFRNRVGGALSWLMTDKSDLILDLSRFDVIVLDNKEDFGDQERVEYNEGVTYERKILDIAVVGVEFDSYQRYYDGTNRNDTLQNDIRVFARGSEAAGGGFPITDHTTFSASVGASAGATLNQSQTPEDSASANDNTETTALNAQATIKTQLSKNLSHSLTYDRGLRGGYNTDFEEYEGWRYSLDYAKAGAGIRVYSGYEDVNPGLVGGSSQQSDESTYSRWVSGVAINYPLTKFMTLDSSYEYQSIDNRDDQSNTDPTNPDDVPQDVTNREDYFNRIARIGTSTALYKDVKFRAYVEHYERLSDVNAIEFTRDTFEMTLAYTHQF